MEAEDWSHRSVKVRTARIAGNRNQEECVEQLFPGPFCHSSALPSSSISDFWSPELEEYVSGIALNHPSVGT